MGSCETFKQLIGEGVVQTSIIKDDSNHEVDAFLKPGDVEGVEDIAG